MFLPPQASWKLSVFDTVVLFLRMFNGDLNPEEQNPEGQFNYESIFRLFKESKVEIASAITNTFPILMGLRDRGFISEQSYQVSEQNFLMINNYSLHYCKHQDAVNKQSSSHEWSISPSYKLGGDRRSSITERISSL